MDIWSDDLEKTFGVEVAEKIRDRTVLEMNFPKHLLNDDISKAIGLLDKFKTKLRLLNKSNNLEVLEEEINRVVQLLLDCHPDFDELVPPENHFYKYDSCYSTKEFIGLLSDEQIKEYINFDNNLNSDKIELFKQGKIGNELPLLDEIRKFNSHLIYLDFLNSEKDNLEKRTINKPSTGFRSPINKTKLIEIYSNFKGLYISPNTTEEEFVSIFTGNNISKSKIHWLASVRLFSSFIYGFDSLKYKGVTYSFKGIVEKDKDNDYKTALQCFTFDQTVTNKILASEFSENKFRNAPRKFDMMFNTIKEYLISTP